MRLLLIFGKFALFPRKKIYTKIFYIIFKEM